MFVRHRTLCDLHRDGLGPGYLCARAGLREVFGRSDVLQLLFGVACSEGELSGARWGSERLQSARSARARVGSADFKTARGSPVAFCSRGGLRVSLFSETSCWRECIAAR